MHAGSKELTGALEYLKSYKLHPSVGIILGTGLGDVFVKHIHKPVIIPYNSIPYFPISTVQGHRGQLVYGEVGKVKVIAMQGRIHYYEGYTPQQITFPIRVMHGLGIKTLLISNAAGNLNPKWRQGDLMLLEDHINLMPDGPLHRITQVEKGSPFLDQSQPYAAALNKKLKAIAKEKKIKLRAGVYVADMGPALETKAEYQYLQFIGGDAVGMSTVPEVIMGNYLGLQCCAISVLTNEMVKEGSKPVALKAILEVAGLSGQKLSTLFVNLIKQLK